MSRYDVIEHQDGFWYLWDRQLTSEVQRFCGPDAEQDAHAAARRSRSGDGGPLRERLEALRGAMAAAAQAVYDEWDQDENGLDEELGAGGICDQIAGAISSLIDDDTIDGGHDGDDHAFLIVTDWETEAYLVDIHPGHYETGGGYSWRKLPGVTFDASMITIATVDVADIADIAGEDY